MKPAPINFSAFQQWSQIKPIMQISPLSVRLSVVLLCNVFVAILFINETFKIVKLELLVPMNRILLLLYFAFCRRDWRAFLVLLDRFRNMQNLLFFSYSFANRSEIDFVDEIDVNIRVEWRGEGNVIVSGSKMKSLKSEAAAAKRRHC